MKINKLGIVGTNESRLDEVLYTACKDNLKISEEENRGFFH